MASICGRFAKRPYRKSDTDLLLLNNIAVGARPCVAGREQCSPLRQSALNICRRATGGYTSRP